MVFQKIIWITMVSSRSSRTTSSYCTSNSSGLELARLADLPSDVIEEGRRVASALADLHARREEESQMTITATRRRAVVKVRLAPLSLASKPVIGCFVAYSSSARNSYKPWTTPRSLKRNW